VYCKINGKRLIVQEHMSVPVDLDTGSTDLSLGSAYLYHVHRIPSRHRIRLWFAS
jgi:hypothetical protein